MNLLPVSESKLTTYARREPIARFLAKRAILTVEPEWEHTDPAECFDSGDKDADAELCNAIRAESEWNPWAWCCVHVRAEYLGFVGDAYLGCCNYASREDFKNQVDCYSEMVEEALHGLAHDFILNSRKIAELATELQAEGRSRG